METKRSLLAAISGAVRGPGRPPGRGTAEGRMPSLDGATGWLNSPPLTEDGLRGRVVAVDFWTYTCINWLRTAPYVRAWAEAYQDAGAVVLGVHTPEFAFESDVDNVRRAVQDRRISYPVAVDSDYGIWTAFANMYWPALYVVDAQGHIRHHHFGEGAYAESERAIRQLLGEAGTGDPLPAPVAVDARGIEAAADWANLRSAENYLGAERTENFASPEGAAVGTRRRYTARSELGPDHWALAGEWTVQPDAVLLAEPGGRIAYPVAVDNDYAIWTAFANMYWPALYGVVAQGYIRYHHFGEGAYEESEEVIRRLLGEAGAGDAIPAPVAVNAAGIEAAADWANLRSAEKYLGAERTEYFASPERAMTGAPRRYTTPSRLAPDHWALSGEWTVQPDAVLLHEPGGRIAYRFSARDLHLVMAPAARGTPVRFGVRLDGQQPDPDHGDDIEDDGRGTATEPRLYQLVRQRGPVTERTLEITFTDPGVRAYAVTFG